MIRFFINQSKVINLISLFIILVGAYYFVTGQKEGFPNIGFDVIVANTAYPGASASDVDRLVTKKIVEAIDQLEGKDEINAVSSEGLSTIIFQVDPDAGVPIDKIVDNIEKEISAIQEDLPSDVKDTFVNELTFQNSSPIIQVAFYSKSDDNKASENYEKDRQLLKKAINEFEREIASFKGVGLTQVDNNPDKQIWIEINQEKLNAYGLDISEVIGAIGRANFNAPGGNVSISGSQYVIKTQKQYESIQDVKDTILRSNNDGKVVTVSDVAKVDWAYEELATSKRIEQKDALILQIFQQVSGDVISIGNQTKKLVDDYKQKYPSLKIFYFDDLSFYVKRRLGVLSNNATIGLILVFLCLLLFFEFKITFWTTLGIPFSFCLAIIVTYALGNTLNLMSMFGFIIVIGMIVDDAIIVAENIYRRYEDGEDIYDAAINGTKEVITPILAITATTVAAFLPLTTLPDIFGKVLGIIPIVVIVTMFASFIECIFVLPGHLAHLKDKRKEKRIANLKRQGKTQHLNQDNIDHHLFDDSAGHHEDESEQKRRWFIWLKNKYEKLITKVMNRPKLTAVLFIVGFLSLMFLLIKNTPVIFFPANLQAITVKVETKIENSLEQTAVILDNVQVAVYKAIKEDVNDYVVNVGTIRDRSGGSRTRDHIGEIQFNLDISRDLVEKEIIAKAENAIKNIDGVEIFEVTKRQGGPPPGDPLRIEMYSDNIGELQAMGKEVKSFVESISNTTSITFSIEEGKNQIIVNVDETKAQLFGVSINKVGQVIRSAFEGSTSVTANSLKESLDDVDVVVKMKTKSITNINNISEIQIKNVRNQNVALNYFTDLSTETGSGKIDRKEGEIYATVVAQLINPRDDKYNASKINQIVRDKLPEWNQLNPNIKFKLSGQEKEQGDLQAGAIKAAIVALAMMFLVLVAIFKSYIQPFIIMSIIPFSFLGVMIGLFVTGNGIGLMPMLGMVALVGIVVNDSLVMVDFINRRRKAGVPKKEAIIGSAVSRLRPILMTTITTVVGIGPLAYGIGGREPFLEPMAIALFWGLSFSTTILLVFLPIVYHIVDEICTWIMRKVFKKVYFPVEIETEESVS